jgi:hypothetical protein
MSLAIPGRQIRGEGPFSPDGNGGSGSYVYSAAPAKVTVPAPPQVISVAPPASQLRYAPKYPVSGPKPPIRIVGSSPAQAAPPAGSSAASVAAAPSSQVAAATTAPAVAPSWFTDPAQEMISGLPNWGLVAVAFGLFLFTGKRR